MGMRFRKSFGGKGFRVNVSKSGIGWSVGGKGFRYTQKAGGGSRTTTSIPGTGISYVKDSKTGKSKKVATYNGYSKTTYKVASIMLRIMGYPIAVLAALFLLCSEIAIGICFAIPAVISLLMAHIYKNNYKELEAMENE